MAYYNVVMVISKVVGLGPGDTKNVTIVRFVSRKLFLVFA
jgi:hypothetical protein